MIRPSKKVGGKPRGKRSNSFPNDDAETIRGIRRENEAADILAQAGYDVEQNPFLRLPGPKNPDYRIEGILFDCYAPRNAKPRNVAAVIEDKIGRGQANSFVIYLKDSIVSVLDLQKQFLDYPINGLNSLIIICRDDTIVSFP